MFLIISIVLMIVGATVFAGFGGRAVLTQNVPAVFALQGIIAAALLVRLNRGIPTIDWKSVDVTDVEALVK